MSKTTSILHVFTSQDSATDKTAQKLIAIQKESAEASVSTITLTPENAKESLSAIFAADNITTWPGTPQQTGE